MTQGPERHPSRQDRWLGARARITVGIVLVALGAGAGGRWAVDAYQRSVAAPDAARRTVPSFMVDAASIARGKVVYERCLACHGVTGRGDGPAGRTLRPPPADFRVHMAAGHTDIQLYEWVAHGVDGTGMPAFADQLSAEEIIDVIGYIRTFAEPQP